MKPFSRNVLSIALTSALLGACSTPEEKALNHFVKGKDFYEKGEWDKALLELKTARQQDSNQAHTYYYLALLDERNQHWQAMRQNLIKGLELKPDWPDAQLKLATAYAWLSESDKALELLDKLLQQQPNRVEALVLKTSLLLRQGNTDAAEKLTSAILALDPDNADALSIKAARYYQQQQWDNALTVVNNALDKNPSAMGLRLLRIKINAAKHQIEPITADYQQLIQQHPDNEAFQVGLASLYALNNQLPAAEQVLRQHMAQLPENVSPKQLLLTFLRAKAPDRLLPEYQALAATVANDGHQLLALAQWLLYAGYGDAASDSLQRVVALEHDSHRGLTAQSLLAEHALQHNDLAAAETHIAAIQAQHADFAPAQLLKAQLHLMQRQPEAAITLLKNASWDKNNNDQAQYLLGQAYSAVRDHKRALQAFNDALASNPAHLNAFNVVYRQLQHSQQFDAAQQRLEKALKAAPNQPQLLAYAVEQALRERNWPQAQLLVQRLALFSADAALPLQLQALLHQGQGHYPEAIALYQKLLSQAPDHATALLNLVRSYQAQQQAPQARAFLETHLQQHPDSILTVGLLSDVYIADHNTAKAKQLLSQQLQRQPKAHGLYLALAHLEANTLNQPAAAEAVLRSGLQQLPQEASLLLALAGLQQQHGNSSGAQQLYQQLLSQQPDNGIARNNLAALLIESPEASTIQQGLALAEPLKDDPNPYFQDTYAWALVKAGHTSEGLQRLESLISQAPLLPELRYHLGIAHSNNGNTATAIAELKQALRLADSQQRRFAGWDDAQKRLQTLAQSSR